jgi:hypothetical protein
LRKWNKIDIDKIDLDDLKERTAENPGQISFPHSVGGAVIKPEDKGKIKGRAMTAMKEQTARQLHQLYEQMRMLAKQANEIKNRVHVSEKIYLSQINFEPVIGEIYYLYQKSESDNILSMISPEEWGKKLPYQTYVAKVKLLADHTWDVMDSNNL